MSFNSFFNTLGFDSGGEDFETAISDGSGSGGSVATEPIVSEPLPTTFVEPVTVPTFERPILLAPDAEVGSDPETLPCCPQTLEERTAIPLPERSPPGPEVFTQPLDPGNTDELVVLGDNVNGGIAPPTSGAVEVMPTSGLSRGTVVAVAVGLGVVLVLVAVRATR